MVVTWLLALGGGHFAQGDEAVAQGTSQEEPAWTTAGFWDRVAACETGGRWDWGSRHRPAEGTTYEGGVGFYHGTWVAWAGAVRLLARYPHAYQAPRLVQIAVAQYGYAHRGYWGCLN